MLSINDQMKILDAAKIEQIIIRIAVQIAENHSKEKKIILAGINNNGYHFAQLIADKIINFTDATIHTGRIQLNPADPANNPVNTDLEDKTLKNASIIIIDDVANTGRTLFHAFRVLYHIIPKSVEVAVLVDRKHKSFPVAVNYVGLSLVTTLNDNINVQLKGKNKSVILE